MGLSARMSDARIGLSERVGLLPLLAGSGDFLFCGLADFFGLRPLRVGPEAPTRIVGGIGGAARGVAPPPTRGERTKPSETARAETTPPASNH